MITGIIYKYISPSNKVYIGQTINEYERKHAFLTREKYAGDKIDNARKKYGPVNFKYEILEKHEYLTVEEASESLNILEAYYIGLYDSFRKGYNMSLGGGGSPGYHLTPEQVEKCRVRMFTDNPFKGRNHTERTKRIKRRKTLEMNILMNHMQNIWYLTCTIMKVVENMLVKNSVWLRLKKCVKDIEELSHNLLLMQMCM